MLILGILSVLGAAIVGVRVAREAGWQIHPPGPRVWLARVGALRVTPRRLILAAVCAGFAYTALWVAAQAML